MKKAASIFLRSDVVPDDVRNLCCWLRNRHVTRFLNEDTAAPEALERLLQTTPSPMLSYHFNRQGRFFLVCDNHEESIGFVKLREHATGCFELVFAIGEEELWGNGYGSQAVMAAQSRAFFEWRAKKLIAKVYHDNIRSIHTVRRCGFREEQRSATLSQYAITMKDYLQMLTQDRLA
jgi:RimJ/RimL family protein N-acetyltransferase